MNAIKYVWLTPCVTLAACAGYPHFSEHQSILISDLKQSVQCELRDAYAVLNKRHSPIGKWLVGFTLDLNVKASAGATAGADRVIQVNENSITPVLGIGATNDTSRSATIKFDVDPGKLDKMDCKARPNSVAARYPATDHLGFGDWLVAVAKVMDEKDGVTPSTLSYGLQFGVKATGGADAGLVFLPISGKVGAALSREETQTIAIAFAPPPSKPSPTEVIVLGSGGKTVRELEPAVTQPRRENPVINDLLNQKLLDFKLDRIDR